jgi:hypothetical protein
MYSDNGHLRFLVRGEVGLEISRVLLSHQKPSRRGGKHEKHDAI